MKSKDFLAFALIILLACAWRAYKNKDAFSSIIPSYFLSENQTETQTSESKEAEENVQPVTIKQEIKKRKVITITQYGPSNNGNPKEGRFLGRVKKYQDPKKDNITIHEKHYCKDTIGITFERYFDYDKYGNVIRKKEIKDGNITFTEYEYDEKGRLVKETTKDKSQDITHYTTINFNKDDQFVSRIEYDGKGNQTVRYDIINTLKVEVTPKNVHDTLKNYVRKDGNITKVKFLDLHTGIWKYEEIDCDREQKEERINSSSSSTLRFVNGTKVMVSKYTEYDFFDKNRIILYKETIETWE